MGVVSYGVGGSGYFGDLVPESELHLNNIRSIIAVEVLISNFNFKRDNI